MPLIPLILMAVLSAGALGTAVWVLRPQETPSPTPPPPVAPPGDFDLTPPSKPAPPPEAPPPPPPSPPGKLSVSPRSIDIRTVIDADGRVRDGDASGRLTLTNTGGQSLTIEELLTAGGYGSFSADNGCTARELPPQGQCVVVVTFRPLQPGAFEGSLVIDHTAGPNERVVLTGLAQPAATPRPSDEAQRIARLRDERAAQVAALAAQGRVVGNVLLRSDPPVIPPAVPAAPRQEGYGDAVASAVATLPVDRARILTRDQVIPAVLKSSVSSRIPGLVLATVERDVWSSDLNRLILIPKGTSLIGRQTSAPRRGDGRLAVAWSELIRPDGVRIVVGGESADAMGRIGLVGEVDNRFWERYGAAILVSLLGTAEDVLMLELSEREAESTTTSGNSTVVVAGQDSANNFGTIARNIVNETLDLPPVITVAQGTRFNVFLTADVVFQGVQQGDARPASQTRQGASTAVPSPGNQTVVQPAPRPVPVAPASGGRAVDGNSPRTAVR